MTEDIPVRVQEVMQFTGMDHMQAINHLKQRELACNRLDNQRRANLNRACQELTEVLKNG